MLTHLLLLFLVFPYLPLFVDSVYFKIDQIKLNENRLLYQGDAVPTNGGIIFTDPAYACLVGQAIYKDAIPIWDSQTEKLTDFTTHFSFTIDTQNASLWKWGCFFLGFSWLSYPSKLSCLHSLDTVDVFISYDSTTKYLSVSWNCEKTPTSLENTTLSYQVDLMKILPQWATVGFSAATGAYLERHLLFSWEFNSSLEMKQSVGVGTEKNGKKVDVIVGVTVSVGASILMEIAAFVLWRLKQKKKNLKKKVAEEVNLTSINDDLETGAGPRRFSHKLLLPWLPTTSPKKGSLVKEDLEQCIEVKIISQLRRQNLVQLVGWCYDKGEFLLVYDGSLDSHLFDSNFNVKLGDFGLARLMDYELGAQTAGLVGTLGYLAPEYISTGRATKEPNLFSFGVVALEIATEKMSRTSMEAESHKGLVEWVWDLYGGGQLIDGMDEKLPSDFDKKQAECLMLVGLWSAYPDPKLRPSMKQVIQVLNFETTMPNLPNKMSLPIYPAPPTSMSSNEASMTVSLDMGR
ncbi:L-type lectin-domain containing receptor kinase IX.1-like [Cucumis melo var. makuwa]|uniref:L-type lectin-domain containing receptor kinase IX.1-like n=1 Tax=Cucumis melo var. makuwa TaxID=1194695 RepID=A0A5A7TMZ9_CUCMM|nr:L-type lectin-domain containing receptor kinase IX.1-like [Cucumis melo var. makuwa]